MRITVGYGDPARGQARKLLRTDGRRRKSESFCLYNFANELSGH